MEITPLHETYYVEKILAKQKFDEEVKYLVKWEGWPLDTSTWEPLNNLENVKDMVNDFEDKLSKQTQSRKEKMNQLAKTRRKENQSDKSEISDSLKVNENKLIKKNNDFNTNACEEEKVNSNVFTTHKNNVEKKFNKNDYDITNEPQITNTIDHKIDKLINAKKISDKLYFLVQWGQSSSGILPEPSYVPNELLKKKHCRELAEFYESKLKFIQKK